MLTSNKGYTPQTSWQSWELLPWEHIFLVFISQRRGILKCLLLIKLPLLCVKNPVSFYGHREIKAIWGEHIPALQAQEPSTGEQVAPFLQLHTEEQFTPYVPGRQGVPQEVPWIIKKNKTKKTSLKTIWGGSDNTTDSSDTKAKKNTAHACRRLSLSCPWFRGEGHHRAF